MAKNCSFFGFGRSSCGESRGVEEVVILGDCQANIEGHLSSCHLCKAKLKEFELIAARAGFFNPTEEQLQSMTVCRSHRNALGRFWRGARSCQYLVHSGRVSKCSWRDVFNLALAENVYTLYGQLVQIRSRKYDRCSLTIFDCPYWN